MKGKSDPRRVGRIPTQDGAETVALQALGRIVEDPDRLGRFLALTGLDPSTIRGAARQPAFLASILDHVVGDETLLLAIAAETGLAPETVAAAQARLSPPSDWSP